MLKHLIWLSTIHSSLYFMETVWARLILLLIASLLHHFAKKVHFPYTILLFISGALFWILNASFWSPIWISIQLTPELLFFVLLPVLIFESWYDINYSTLSRNYIPIWWLATVGMITCSGLIGVWVWFFSWLIGYEIPASICFLLWIIISATDPVAVLSLFKTLWVPKRLRLIFEWESLFNDWTAIALFLVTLATLLSWRWWIDSVFTWIWQFVWMIVLWIVLGSALWIIFSLALKRIKNNAVSEIGLVILLWHLVFFLSEYISHLFIWRWIPVTISWVIATAYAAMIIGNYWKTKISPKVETSIHQFLEFFAFASNGAIFLLMGLIVQQQNIDNLIFLFPIIAITLIVMIWARAFSVYGTLWITNLFTKNPIPLKRQHTLVRWSLRWVVSLIMVFLIPSSLLLPWREFSFSPQEFLLTVTISVIIFSLVVQWLTMKRFTRKLNINWFYDLEEFEQYESEIIVYHRILIKIKTMKIEYHIAHEAAQILEEKYIAKLDESRLKMEYFLDTHENDRELIKQALALHALWMEKQYLKEMFKYNEVPENLYHYMMRKIDVQESRIRKWSKQIRWFKKWEHISSRNKRDPIIWLIDTLHTKKWSCHDSYIISRTRLIVTSKVIQALNDLRAIDFWYDSSMIENPMKLYQKFHYNAHREINYLKIQDDHEIDTIDSILLNKWLAKTEELVIKDLLHKDMITEKIYKHFMDEIEEEVLRTY